MGSQQSRLQNHHQQLQESEVSVLDEKEKLEEKTKCWKFPNCHKFQNQESESDVYKPYPSNQNLNLKEESADLLNQNFSKKDENEKKDKNENEDFGKSFESSINGPSIAAGTIVGTWKTGSVKRPDNLQFDNSQRSSGEESAALRSSIETPLHSLMETPLVHDSTISIYSDISSLRNESAADYFLSEHSQDMLMHIIRCFPFPSPKNSPKVVKKNESNDSVYGPCCDTEPSSSSDVLTPTVSPTKPKKHLFKKHGNPVSNFFHIHHHANHEKRKRTESTLSENALGSKKEEKKLDPGTLSPGRPYAHSTTSAPSSCLGNGFSGGTSTETINGGIRKGALSTLCQSSKKKESSILEGFFRIKDRSRVQKTKQILSGKKLKLWCTQVCTCVRKAPRDHGVETLKLPQDQMTTVSKRLPSFVEPCSSTTPCCGELAQLEYTMAITALPLDCWLKERLKNWVQLSGHYGTIVPATNQTLWKKIGDPVEARAYEKITKDTVLNGFTPRFYKEIQHKNESFIEIQDLLADFPNMGTRTEEHAEKAITKLRYMQFRERESTSQTLGFRIEAAQLSSGFLQKSFKKVREREQVLDTVKMILGDRLEEVSKQFETRLREMRKSVEKSEFFRTHEVVGSSILFVFDNEKSGAWMIDFAKSNELEGDMTLNHRTSWEIGNHEDGYLIGLDNLIQIFSECHS
ncbi:hypothetical protein FO519_007290 [Halicephalobus sp. NKZ332]|nr:hypothetical protein FO519_007290 [Halicephalobus sp. NKZ332]